jgi:hypothetical protein
MASILWTSVFVLLCLELALTLILVIPVPHKMRNWICRKVSKLDLKHRLKKPLWFTAIALGFALLDCVSFLQTIFSKEKEAHERSSSHPYSYSGEEGLLHQIDKEQEYRTERNIYLAGFALTLLFVIGRITDLMQEHADLEDELEKIRLSSKPAVDSSTGEESSSGVVEIEMKPIETKKND